MLTLMRLGASMVPAFFLAGAVVFPLLDNFYLSRVLLTGGIAALLYGLESVVRMGHIETCGLLTGNCSQHSVRLIGCLIWIALFVLWPRLVRPLPWRDRTLAPDTGNSVSTLTLTLSLSALLIGVWWVGTSVFKNTSHLQNESRPAPIVKAARTHPPKAAVPHGLTFGLMQPEVPGVAAMVTLGCHAQPAPADQPHQDSCNPYQGDTSCRAELPIACRKSADISQLGATRAVTGSLLKSLKTGSERCAAELGAGWQMATFHDGSGWQISGQHTQGLRPSTRYWVAIGDQPGNCWNPPRP